MLKDILSQHIEFIYPHSNSSALVEKICESFDISPTTENKAERDYWDENDSFLITYGSIFFVFYVLGLYWFGVRAGISSNSAIVATLSGGFLGFLAYGTYGLTNYIFFKGYPLSITLLDITWGAVLGGAVSFCGYLIFVRFFYRS